MPQSPKALVTGRADRPPRRGAPPEPPVLELLSDAELPSDINVYGNKAPLPVSSDLRAKATRFLDRLLNPHGSPDTGYVLPQEGDIPMFGLNAPNYWPASLRTGHDPQLGLALRLLSAQYPEAARASTSAARAPLDFGTTLGLRHRDTGRIAIAPSDDLGEYLGTLRHELSHGMGVDDPYQLLGGDYVPRKTKTAQVVSTDVDKANRVLHRDIILPKEKP